MKNLREIWDETNGRVNDWHHLEVERVWREWVLFRNITEEEMTLARFKLLISNSYSQPTREKCFYEGWKRNPKNNSK